MSVVPNKSRGYRLKVGGIGGAFFIRSHSIHPHPSWTTYPVPPHPLVLIYSPSTLLPSPSRPPPPSTTTRLAVIRKQTTNGWANWVDEMVGELGNWWRQMDWKAIGLGFPSRGRTTSQTFLPCLDDGWGVILKKSQRILWYLNANSLKEHTQRDFSSDEQSSDS